MKVPSSNWPFESSIWILQTCVHLFPLLLSSFRHLRPRPLVGARW